jgi:hypothetical protein
MSILGYLIMPVIKGSLFKLPLLLTGAISLSVMSLGSCSTTPGSAGETRYESSDATPEGRLFGDYLAGTYANHVDDAQARSKHFTNAFELDSQSAGLGRRAITSALTAGEFDAAVRLAKKVDALGTPESMATAILGAQHFDAGRYSAALSKFDIETQDLTVSILMKLMQAWRSKALAI